MVFSRRDDDGFGGFSVWRMLTYPFRAVAEFFGEFFERNDSISEDLPFWLRVVAFLTFPFRFFWGFLVFMVQAWPPSRSGFAFLRGAPAMLGLALFVGGYLTADLFFNEARRIGSTAGYLAHHMENSPEFPEYSMMFAEKLAEIKPDDPNHVYQLALAYERTGNVVKANDAMSSIAFDEHAGFPLAHVWRSQYYLRSDLIDMAEEGREELARKHLAFAVDAAEDNIVANYDLAQLFLRQANRMDKGSEEYNKNLELAIEKLDLVADGGLTFLRLKAIPEIVELQMELGRDELARKILNREIIMLRSFARKQPEVLDFWRVMMRCAILLKDFPRAFEIAEEALLLNDDRQKQQEIRQLAAQIFIEKSSEFKNMSDRDEYRNRINALCQSIGLNQQNRVVYLKLLDFIGTKKPADMTNSQTTGIEQRLDFSGANDLWLGDSIIESPVPGVIHALLGMREISNGNVDKGETHWQMAEKQFLFTQVVIKNLIDVAAKERPNEFSNMLDMITLGIELFPDQPGYYQTRGVYLMNQNRIEDAIKDLIFASEKLPNTLSLQKYLVECYEKLGDDEKRLKHERLLNEMLDELSAIDRLNVERQLERID